MGATRLPVVAAHRRDPYPLGRGVGLHAAGFWAGIRSDTALGRAGDGPPSLRPRSVISDQAANALFPHRWVGFRSGGRRADRRRVTPIHRPAATVGAARERTRRRRVAAVVAVFMLGVTAWALFVPVDAYLERTGRRASCGSVRDPKPYALGDEVCFDELHGRENVAYATGALAGLLVVGVLATSPAVTARVRRRSVAL
jgi:hypothetical protein